MLEIFTQRAAKWSVLLKKVTFSNKKKIDFFNTKNINKNPKKWVKICILAATFMANLNLP